MILRIIPLRLSLILGRILGFLVWSVSGKQKRISYKNLRSAFYKKKDIGKIKSIIWSMYQHLGLCLAEIANFARLDKSYIDSYIDVEGFKYIEEEKKKKKGLIFLTAHFGNWELSSQVVSLLGYPTKVLARQQKTTFIDEILNKYRSLHGCKVITKGANLKIALRTLNNQEDLGMLADEDVKKNGAEVKFFGRTVLAPRGPMSIAFRTKSPIVLSFLSRIKGMKHKLTLQEPYYIKNEEDIQKGLQHYCDELSNLVEDCPEQWLWLQKRWRSSRERNIIILSDNKAGHLNQSKAVGSWLKEELNKRALRVSLPYQDKEEVKILKPEYRHRLYPVILNIAVQSKLYKLFPELLLKLSLSRESFREIIMTPIDYLISCGNSLSALNVIIKYINLSTNIIIMKPTLPLGCFDLAVVPAHDKVKNANNVVITQAAPNIINQKQKDEISGELIKGIDKDKKTLSLFLGGDAQFLKYEDSFVQLLISTVKQTCEEIDINLLVTTSRRTSESNESICKRDLSHYKNCKYLVIANENNPPHAASAMLAASNVVLVTFDSISMISEAVNSKSHVIVILPDILENLRGFEKHKRLIKHFLNKEFISVATVEQLNKVIKNKLNQKNKAKVLNEELQVKAALVNLI
jgi:KDO2-lipid IV(A) lauroyltransferase